MFKKLFGGWVRKTDGVTAIEFSLLFIPYLLLSLAIIELSLMFVSASLLEGATGSAARLIRTGQLQQSGGDQVQMFRDALCDYTSVLISCDDLRVEVQELASFGDAEALAPQYDEDGNLVEAFSPGGSDSSVLIRVAFRYQMMVPLVGPLLTGPGGSMLFMSTIVLRTEPYEFGGS